MRLISRFRRRARQGERGVVMPLVAAAMVALSGFVALSVDIGRTASERRHLQNATDAAALAGAAALPGDTGLARANALKWAQSNGYKSPDTFTVNISKTNFDDDTIEVTIKRQVGYTFAKVIGLNSGTTTTTARVILDVTTGFDTQKQGLFPYGVWGGNKNGPSDVKAGQSVTYRSNQYANRNVTPIPGCTNGKKNNCNWGIQSNTFKGYFHWKNRYVYIDADTKETFNQGGNAFGTEPIDDLIKFQKAGIPVWLPLISAADDNGSDLHFIIANFVCVLLDPLDEGGGSDWTGTVLDPAEDGRCNKNALRGAPGETPSPDLMPVYTFHLIK